MNFIISISMGINSLRANPLRSLLAILGVVIGVAAVISVVAFGEGHRQRIQKEVDKLGADIFWIRPIRQRIDPSESDRPKLSYRPQYFKYKDVETLSRYATKIRKIASFKNFHSTVFVNNQKVDLGVIFTEQAYQEIAKIKLINGRFLNDSDIYMGRKVCVIEYCDRLKKEFAINNPLESFVYINNIRFKIIGLVEKKKELVWSGFSDNIYIPISTMKFIYYDDYIEKIYCQTERALIKDAMYQAEKILKSKYRGKKLFEAYNANKMYQSAEKLTRTASLVTAGIATISLLVGGIGIMNIMLVSVTERTREIGIKKAIGAKIRDIRYQFLFESILLTSIGGILGIIKGVFLAKTIGAAIQIPIVISWVSIIIGMFFSIGIGVISGLYPAFKASKLDPIEALRYE